MGRGLYAEKDLEAGELVIVEKALVNVVIKNGD